MTSPEQSAPTLTLVNGEYSDSLSVFDRGLAHGDGLFETIRIVNATPVLLEAHLERLATGLARLAIALPISQVEAQCLLLIERARKSDWRDGVVKIIATRGVGGRGFRYDSQIKPSLILSWHALADYPARLAEEGVQARLCQTRLPQRPALAGLKHLNGLEYVLAAAELSSTDFDEGILLDVEGSVIEATSSNIFLVRAPGRLQTPCLDSAGVAGVMRRFIIERVLPQLGMACTIAPVTVGELEGIDEMFICNSVYGVRPVAAISARNLKPGETSRAIQLAVSELLHV